jgi:hypothetical protein
MWGSSTARNCDVLALVFTHCFFCLRDPSYSAAGSTSAYNFAMRRTVKEASGARGHELMYFEVPLSQP